MRSSRLLIGLLVAATLLVDLVALSVVTSGGWPPPKWPHAAVVVLVSLMDSQICLVAIWASLSRASVPWRLVCIFLNLACWAGLETLVNPEPPSDLTTTLCMLFLLVQTLAIVVPLSTARLAGVKLVELTDGRLPQRGPPALRSRQFSLRYLFAWMTAVAVVLSILRLTVHGEYFYLVSGLPWWHFAVSFVATAAIALAALWAALGTRRPAWRFALPLLATAAAIAASYYTPRTISRSASAVYCLLQMLWLLGSLYVVRVAGYRLVRAGRARQIQDP